MSLKLFIRPTKIIGVQFSLGPVSSYTHCVWDLCVSRVVSYLHFHCLSSDIVCLQREWRIMATNRVIREESNERQRQGQRASADTKNSTQLQTKENKQYLIFSCIACPSYTLSVWKGSGELCQRNHMERVKWKAQAKYSCQECERNPHKTNKQAISYLHILFLSPLTHCLLKKLSALNVPSLLLSNERQRQGPKTKRNSKQRYLIFIFFSCPCSLIVCLQSFQCSMRQVCSFQIKGKGKFGRQKLERNPQKENKQTISYLLCLSSLTHCLFTKLSAPNVPSLLLSITPI